MLVEVSPIWPKRAKAADTRVRIKVGKDTHTFTEAELHEVIADATQALRVMNGCAQSDEVAVFADREPAREA